jgi:hypothetical protein
MAQPTLVRSVKDLQLCDACANELGALEREAMVPLIVAAFAQFVSDWTTTLPTEPSRYESTDRFWEALAPFGDAVDVADIREMLEALVACRMAVHRSPSSLRASPVGSS